MRQALELSMTSTPAAAKRGACTFDMVAPAEKIAMSSPVGSAVAASSTDDLLAAERERRAGAARSGEEADLGDREVALVEEAAHDGADLAGGADDAETDARCCSSGNRTGARIP